jgi:rhodanese-related sulfurtransferase
MKNILLVITLLCTTALMAESMSKIDLIKNATTIKGGLNGWVKAGYPVKTGLGMLKLSHEK